MTNSIDVVAMMTALAASPITDRAERSAVLDVARQPVAATLGKPVVFKVRTLHRAGDWAFLLADMQDRDGKPFDYAGTSLADAARRGLVSHAYAALLAHRADGWHVVEHAIGPTDVAWEGWGTQHHAPAALFKAVQ